MIERIELFFFNLSVLFSLKYLFQFIVELSQSNPEPIKVGYIEKVLLYFAIAYIVTSLVVVSVGI